VIYVIPYTSIIEQTAQEFRKHLGEDNVLEHHSNYAFEDVDDDELTQRELHVENWDAPIIVTTNVQFFESLFSSKPGKCRKIHNIANSVIILDEAQMLPIPFLTPCKRALKELVEKYNCTAVLMSATQPPHFGGAIEIMPNAEELGNFFNRTKIIKLGPKSDDELVCEILKEPQVLVIVNIKSHAAALSEKLGGTYCLTTNMYPAHRSRVLAEIKERLKNSDKPVRVVSTQLMEAGVDINFPVVFRAACGLDSLVQSAGRCNRERNLPEFGRVYSFESPDENLRGHLQRAAILGQSAADIQDYFAKQYKLTDNDAKKIMDEFRYELNFETVGNKFKLIDDCGRQVIIPHDDKAKDLLEKLKYAEYKKGILRKLRKYAVNVRQDIDLPTEIIADIAEVLCDVENYYDADKGLKTYIGAEAIFA
jgi:CRISPR-associated endonuclease/helicase Cas3